MRLIFKLLAFPFMLVTGILYLVCKFLVIASGAVLGILSGIVFLASLVLFFTAGMWAGLAWLVIAFLISPLRSANGGGLAGRDDRRRKPRTQGFCIWINLWAGHFQCPALFFTIRGCLTRQLFFYLEGSHERHNTTIYLSGFLCA